MGRTRTLTYPLQGDVKFAHKENLLLSLNIKFHWHIARASLRQTLTRAECCGQTVTRSGETCDLAFELLVITYAFMGHFVLTQRVASEVAERL